MTETKTLEAGVSDNQMKTLIGGQWVDDFWSLPGWERQMTDGDGKVIKQCVWATLSNPLWNADSGDKKVWVDSLDEALQWCDNQVGNNIIKRPVGTATRQAGRFAKAQEA